MVREQLYLGILLTVLLQTPDNAIPDPTQSATKKPRRPKPWDRILNRNTATSETKSESSLGSTVYASTKVVIDVVKESSDVFPPLKSVVGGLSAILKHCDVCSTSPPINNDAEYYPSKQLPTDKQLNL